MAQTYAGQKRIRKFFGKIREVLDMPNLIEVQKSSYDLFLNSGDAPKPTDGEGIMGVFQSVFPIKDFNETAVLEFVKYELESPKFDVEECQQRDLTYAAPLKVTLRLIVFDVDEDTGAKSVKDIKEQDVFMGDMPLMTPNGTFIVNGTERVIVSQMHRSPGVFFDHDKGKTHSSGKLLFACRIIPYRGSWLDFEFDAKDLVFARIDRRRKLPVTTLLYALGLDQEGIMDAYYDTVEFKLAKKNQGWTTKFFPERVRGTRPTFDLVDAKTGEVIAEASKKITPRAVKQLIDSGEVTELLVPFDQIVGKLRRQGHHQRGNRRDLCRGRGRADLGSRQGWRCHWRYAQGVDRRGHHRDPGARHRQHHRRPVHAQHHGRGQEPEPRHGADGHLSRHAPG
jgi:DNA-directed RNA polymerase subunit beta